MEASSAATRDISAVRDDSPNGGHVGLVPRPCTTDPRPGSDAFRRRQVAEKLFPQVVENPRGCVAIPEIRPMSGRRLDGPVSREQIDVIARQLGATACRCLSLLSQD